jgi:lysine-specific demethylase 3
VFPIYRHESEEAMGIWLPVMLDELIEEQDVTISFFIPNLKEQFFVIIKTKEEHADRSKKIWKKIVSRTYETCDRFETSIFNLHYMCGSCGYMECIHCYKKIMAKTTQKFCKYSSSKFSLVELIPDRALQFLQEKFPLNLENFRRKRIIGFND